MTLVVYNFSFRCQFLFTFRYSCSYIKMFVYFLVILFTILVRKFDMKTFELKLIKLYMKILQIIVINVKVEIRN